MLTTANDVKRLIDDAQQIAVYPSLTDIYHYLDLTNLDLAATSETITDLCQRALAQQVAAVCIYPEHLPLARALLAGSAVKLATVANFPQGTCTIKEIVAEILRAIDEGAQEIDVVFPYSDFLGGDIKAAGTLIAACRQACVPAVLLKVILETGALNDPDTIYQASRLAIAQGADFIKTSTGKGYPGASLQAAAAMLLVVRDSVREEHPIGLKVSGGIRTLAQAQDFWRLAAYCFGTDHISAANFRIGASRL
jgi:deoxyribose-phosphate aldolase